MESRSQCCKSFNALIYARWFKRYVDTLSSSSTSIPNTSHCESQNVSSELRRTMLIPAKHLRYGTYTFCNTIGNRRGFTKIDSNYSWGNRYVVRDLYDVGVGSSPSSYLIVLFTVTLILFYLLSRKSCCSRRQRSVEHKVAPPTVGSSRTVETPSHSVQPSRS